MEERLKKLYKASINGSLISLHDLLQEDPLIFDRFTVTSYAETPLHIASMLGHLGFCTELLTQKPELSGELDSRRSSALHLASAKGHVEIVKILLVSRPQMCLEVDGDGNNPIHLAAMKGRVDVLNELVRLHPDAALARVRICEGGTILHLCVHYYQFGALKFLIEVLKNEELLKAKDDDGNSILHLAVINKQVEMIQYLMDNTQIDIGELNLNGLTALDLLVHTQRDSKYLQILVRSLQLSTTERSQQTSPSQRNPSSVITSSTTISNNAHDLLAKKKFYKESWLENQRNSIMVVASLIATMAFQAGISPRGGFWQDESDTHEAGNPIWEDKNPDNYKVFLISNTIGFLSSVSIILFLISGLPLKNKLFMWILTVIMWISISATTLTYGTVVGSRFGWVDYVVIGWLYLMAFLILVHTIRLVFYRTRYWTIKRRIYFWIFMSIFYIGVEEFLRRHLLGIDFSIFVSAWMVLVTFLILQYVFQLVRFVVRKMRGRYPRINSSNQNSIVL